MMLFKSIFINSINNSTFLLTQNLKNNNKF